MSGLATSGGPAFPFSKVAAMDDGGLLIQVHGEKGVSDFEVQPPLDFLSGSSLAFYGKHQLAVDTLTRDYTDTELAVMFVNALININEFQGAEGEYEGVIADAHRETYDIGDKLEAVQQKLRNTRTQLRSLQKLWNAVKAGERAARGTVSAFPTMFDSRVFYGQETNFGALPQPVVQGP